MSYTGKAWREANKLAGMCPECGKRPCLRDRKSCRVCLNKVRDTQKARKLAGLCYACGKRPPAKVKSKCSQCSDKARFKRTGFTREMYDDFYKVQEGRCAICGGDGVSHRCAGLTADHCHATGDPRGLLCGFCNTALGGFKDDPELLRAALRYLGDFGG